MFISGTTGYDYATMTIPDDVVAQARNVYKTFAAVLAEAGGGLENIVSLRTFVTSADYCVPVLRLRAKSSPRSGPRRRSM